MGGLIMGAPGLGGPKPGLGPPPRAPGLNWGYPGGLMPPKGGWLTLGCEGAAELEPSLSETICLGVRDPIMSSFRTASKRGP